LTGRTRLRFEITPVGDRLVLGLFGELRHRDVPQVRTHLLKCLAEQPAALVVDLAGADLVEPVSLAIFATVARQSEAWPGAPVLLSVTDRRVVRLLANGGYGRLPVFTDRSEALAADPGRGTPSLSDVLLPAAGAARHARELAVLVCDRWELSRTADAAAAVTSEMVTNAVVHARTMMDLRFSRGRHYLLVAVRDGSDRPPRPDRGPSGDPATGRGLLLVDRLALHWGSFPAAGGKVVWAALPAGKA
jgi:anti-anti-sigma factor